MTVLYDNKRSVYQLSDENGDTEYVEILTGVRRSGNSSILQLLKEALLQSGADGHQY